MNKYDLIIPTILLLTLIYATVFGLKYSQVTIVFGFVALLLAPLAIHRVSSVGWASGHLSSLALFASFPFNKLFQLNGTIWGFLVIFAYWVVLWTIGAGWRRSWK